MGKIIPLTEDERVQIEDKPMVVVLESEENYITPFDGWAHRVHYNEDGILRDPSFNSACGLGKLFKRILNNGGYFNKQNEN
ncbi:MAG: hypothetical protein ABIA78_03300 [archaeon]